MKAVVLEIRKNEAAVLCEDGQIVKVRKSGLTVGETVEISKGDICPDKRTVFYKKLRQGGAVAAAVALLLGFGGNHVYNTALACSYVSLDINPSIEYTLNRKNRVLDVEAVNEDAEEIVAQLKENGVKNESLSDAISMTADLLQENGYITEDATDYILINVASDDDSKSEALKKEAQSAIDGMNTKDKDNIHLTMTESSVSEREEARDQGVSAGEYREIRSIGDEDVSKYKDMKVKDLLENAGEIDKKDSGSESPDPENAKEDVHDDSSEPDSEDSREKKPEGNAGDSYPEQSGEMGQDVQNGQDSQKAQDKEERQDTENSGESFSSDESAGEDRSQTQQMEDPDQNSTDPEGSQGQQTENNVEQNIENGRGNSGNQNGNSSAEDGPDMSGQGEAAGNGPEGGKN